MAIFDFRRIRCGVRVTVMYDDQSCAVSTDLNRREAERIVRDFCDSAGLPEPWKKA